MMGLPAGISGSSGQNVGVVDVSFYTNGTFTDLCRGPHVEHTGAGGAFKLMKVAGAYWRGKEKNPQMQRLYGVAFATKEELNEHLWMREEAKTIACCNKASPVTVNAPDAAKVEIRIEDDTDEKTDAVNDVNPTAVDDKNYTPPVK